MFVKYGFERQSPFAQQLLLPWGGAVARVAEDATPMTKRDAPWITHPFAVWEDAADDDANIEWARAFRRDIAHYANGGVYLNFIGDEGEDRVRAAYGEEKYAGSRRSRASGTRPTSSGATRTSNPLAEPESQLGAPTGPVADQGKSIQRSVSAQT